MSASIYLQCKRDISRRPRDLSRELSTSRFWHWEFGNTWEVVERGESRRIARNGGATLGTRVGGVARRGGARRKLARLARAPTPTEFGDWQTGGGGDVDVGTGTKEDGVAGDGEARRGEARR